MKTFFFDNFAIVDDKYLNVLNDADEFVRKPVQDLIELDITEVEKLSNKQLFVGQEVNKEIRNFGLTPDYVQLKWFFDNVKTYHRCQVPSKIFQICIK